MLSLRKPDVQLIDIDSSDHTELKEVLKYPYVDTKATRNTDILQCFSKLARMTVKSIISCERT